MASLALGFLFIALSIFGLASGCNIIRSGLTPKQKGLILLLHNYYRNMTAAGKTPGQPPAANMQEMTWNDEVAIAAQDWTNNCVFQPDPDRAFHGSQMGQNLAIIMMSSENEGQDGILENFVKMWFDEYKAYRFGGSFKSYTGHYTQLVWHNSNQVGCGFTTFKEGSWFKIYLACNYYPTGNLFGQKPYEPGMRSCSKFGLKDSTNFKYLCSH